MTMPFKEIIKYLPIFFLSLGCFGAMGKFIGLSFIVFLINLVVNKEDRALLIDYNSKVFKYSVGLMCFFLLTLAIPAAFRTNAHAEIKEILHYLERMIPFFLVILYSSKGQKLLPSLWAGVFGAAVYIDVTTVLESLKNPLVRPGSIFNDTNVLGGMLIVIIPVMFLMGKTVLKSFSCLRILNNLICCCTIFILFLDASRGAISGFLTIVMFYLGYSIFIKKSMSLKTGVVAFLVFLVLTAIGFKYLPHSILRSYDGERLLLWKSGLAMLKDYPLTGIGLMNFKEVYINQHYASPLAKELNLLTFHNIYIQFLATTGILGMLGIASIFFFQIKTLCNALKKKINPEEIIYAMCAIIIGILVHGIVDTIFLNRNLMMCFWLMWGTTIFIINKENNNG